MDCFLQQQIKVTVSKQSLYLIYFNSWIACSPFLYTDEGVSIVTCFFVLNAKNPKKQPTKHAILKVLREWLFSIIVRVLFFPCHFGFPFRDQSSSNAQFCRDIASFNSEQPG